MRDLREVRLYASLHRHFLLAGCERTPLLVLTMVCIMLGVAGSSLVSATLGVALWLLGFRVLHSMASADPQMKDVYLRHIRFRNRYIAAASPWEPQRRIRPWPRT